MNYFLDYKLKNPSAGELRTNAENTFLLALDGDVDFKPKALILLIDLMKRSQKVGAVCGRIHPIGSGMKTDNVDNIICTRRSYA